MSPEYHERAHALAVVLHDLGALRRASAKDDPHLLPTALRVLHEAEAAWFDVPRIALCLGSVKQLILTDTLRGMPVHAAVKDALTALRRRLPQLPVQEKRMLDIDDAGAAADGEGTQVLPSVTEGGYPRRIPGAALKALSNTTGRTADTAGKLPQVPAADVETLERTLKALLES